MQENRSLQRPTVDVLQNKYEICDYIHTTYTYTVQEVCSKSNILLRRPKVGYNTNQIKQTIYDLQHVFYRQGIVYHTPYDEIDGCRYTCETWTRKNVDAYLQRHFANIETETYRWYQNRLIRFAYGELDDITSICHLYIWMIHNEQQIKRPKFDFSDIFLCWISACQTPNWLDMFVEPDDTVDAFIENISTITHRPCIAFQNAYLKANKTILPLIQNMDEDRMYATVTRVYTLLYYMFIQGEVDRFMYQDSHTNDLLVLYRKLTQLRAVIGAV